MTKLIQRDLQQQAKEMSQAARDKITGLVRGLSPEQLSIRSIPKSWTVAEVLEHLCISDEILEKPMRQAIAGARADAGAPLRVWKSTLLGGFIASSLVNPRKVKTPKVFEPSVTPRGGVLEAYLQFDHTVMQLMDEASQLDWRSIKIKSPALPPFVPGYNLGDVFRIHAVHTTRHAGQIERTIAAM